MEVAPSVDMHCAECGQPMTYIWETWPDQAQSLKAWCVNGERGCKLAGKHVELEPQELNRDE